MKKVLTFMVCLLLLLCSCHEKQSTGEKIGNCFLHDGIRQNTLVTLAVENAPLTEPATNITFVFQNDSDYPVSAHYQQLCVEQLCDGTWSEVKSSNARIEPLVSPFTCAPHTSHKETLIFLEGNTAYHATYPPLTAGSYRMRVPAWQNDLPEGVILYNIEFVAYFTVEAAQ